MKLRARLMLAFLLLAVIPLTGLVTYSYVSSRDAFRRTVEHEAQTQAEAMNRRLGAVRSALDRGLGEAAQATLANEADQADDTTRQAALLDRLRQAMGPAAPLVQAFEWIPAGAEAAAGATPAPEAPPSSSEAPAPPAPAPPAALILPNPVSGGGEHRAAGGSKGSPAPPPPAVPDVEEIIRQAMEQADAAQDHAMKEIAKLPPRERREAGRWLHAAGAAVRGLAAEKLKEAQKLRTDELKKLEQERAEAERLFGRQLSRTVEENGRVVGHLRVQVRARQLLHGVLAAARRDEGEIPFAVDKDGTLYTVDPDDEKALAGLPLTGDEATISSADDQ